MRGECTNKGVNRIILSIERKDSARGNNMKMEGSDSFPLPNTHLQMLVAKFPPDLFPQNFGHSGEETQVLTWQLDCLIRKLH